MFKMKPSVNKDVAYSKVLNLTFVELAVSLTLWDPFGTSNKFRRNNFAHV